MKIAVIILFTVSLGLFFVFSGNKADVQVGTIAIPPLLAKKDDSSLHCINGFFYYRQQLFSGVIKDVYANGRTHHEVCCYNGKEEGWTVMYYPDGLVAEKRYYHLGEKDSVHTGWWQNGNRRFEYHFRQGLYHGYYKEWYYNGQVYKNIHYTNGIDDSGQGWRENGKLFMNYTMHEGRRYGIVNANLCYTLTNEKGEFSVSPLTQNKNGWPLNNGSKPR